MGNKVHFDKISIQIACNMSKSQGRETYFQFICRVMQVGRIVEHKSIKIRLHPWIGGFASLSSSSAKPQDSSTLVPVLWLLT